MGSWLTRLTLNQRLAAIGLVLGAVAVFASPYQGSTVTLDTRALALDVATDADQVAPEELAAWILGGRADFRLVDLRSEAEFAQGAVPTAENIPASSLLDAGLLRNETLVLYGDDGVQTAQAWVLLRASGYRGARFLKGGIAAWRDQVVFPLLAANPTPEQQTENDKRAAIAAYFGGQARVPGAAADSSSVAVGFPRPDSGQATRPGSPAPPRVVAPVAPAGGAKAPAKKKREGC